jgi:hypothetical protein
MLLILRAKRARRRADRLFLLGLSGHYGAPMREPESARRRHTLQQLEPTKIGSVTRSVWGPSA